MRYDGKQTLAEPLTAQVVLLSTHTIEAFAKELMLNCFWLRRSAMHGAQPSLADMHSTLVPQM